MKFRLLSSKREVKIVPISFGLVKKRVAKWPIWSFCYHAYMVYIYIYQLQNRKGCRADPLSEVTRERLKKSPQINFLQL